MLASASAALQSERGPAFCGPVRELAHRIGDGGTVSPRLTMDQPGGESLVDVLMSPLGAYPPAEVEYRSGPLVSTTVDQAGTRCHRRGIGHI